jgi:hypothetical protein
MAVRHVTLTANTVTQVSLTDRDLREVAVVHKGNAVEPLYVTAEDITPTVNGDDCYVVLPGAQRWIPRLWSKGKPTVVSLISAGTVDVEVQFP